MFNFREESSNTWLVIFVYQGIIIWTIITKILVIVSNQ